MNTGCAQINVAPTTLDEGKQQSTMLELVKMARMTSGDDYKYTYNFGFRKIGDSLLELKKDNHQWQRPQDVELRLICRAPADQSIPYVDIKVDQSSVEHDAKVLAGGIGKDFVEILVTARSTYWFKYEARYYGRLSACADGEAGVESLMVLTVCVENLSHDYECTFDE